MAAAAAAFINDVVAGKYDSVSAGEVCTIQKAKDLGVFDKTSYFTKSSGYDSNVRVFNKNHDRANRHTLSLCVQNSDGTEARAECGAEFGFGFVRKPGYPDKCIAAECPAGFEEPSAGVCKKPLKDATLLKRSKCDERWYDWFAIPNYHLGNRYYAPKEGQCYGYCPPGNVPVYAKDPVDGSAVDLSSKDDLTKCVSRQEYFGGKYAEGSEYCPVAWIHRMAATPESMRRAGETLKKAALANAEGVEGENSDVARKFKEVLAADSKNAAVTMSKMLENVQLTSSTQAAACKRVNTVERLTNAYKICEAIQKDEERYLQRLNEDSAGAISEAQNMKRVQVTKQACNALFCNPKVDPYTADLIGRDPICFKDPSKVNLTESAGGEPLPDPEKGPAFFRRSVGNAAKIVFLVIIGVFAYYGWTRFAWPRILRPLLRLIRRILTGWSSSARGDQVGELIDKIGKPRA